MYKNNYNYKQASDNPAIINIAFATKNPEATLSRLLEVIVFYHSGRGLYLGNFVWFIPFIWSKKHKKLNPSASLENIDLKQKEEKKLNDVNTFNNPISNIKEFTYFQDKPEKINTKNTIYNTKITWYFYYFCNNIKFHYVVSYKKRFECFFQNQQLQLLHYQIVMK